MAADPPGSPELPVGATGRPRRFPEPGPSARTSVLFATYLSFYRESVIAKLDDLSDDQLRRSVLPSGWTPLELIKHLVFMERRWFVWGFEGRAVDEPWADNRDGLPDTAWHVGAEESLESLVALLRSAGRRTGQILADHDLTEIAPPGPRFVDREPASLLWICFHVLNEYARHLGHLDIVRELIDGSTGE